MSLHLPSILKKRLRHTINNAPKNETINTSRIARKHGMPMFVLFIVSERNEKTLPVLTRINQSDRDKNDPLSARTKLLDCTFLYGSRLYCIIVTVLDYTVLSRLYCIILDYTVL